MIAATGTASILSRRIKSTVVTGLLALALTVGAGAASMQADAAGPTAGQANGQTQTTGPTFPTVGASAVAKPKATAKPKPQPPVICVHFSQSDWIMVNGEDPGPGGFTNCFFETEW